jgi:hypothetical protein
VDQKNAPRSRQTRSRHIFPIANHPLYHNCSRKKEVLLSHAIYSYLHNYNQSIKLLEPGLLPSTERLHACLLLTSDSWLHRHSDSRTSLLCSKSGWLAKLATLMNQSEKQPSLWERGVIQPKYSMSLIPPLPFLRQAVPVSPASESRYLDGLSSLWSLAIPCQVGTAWPA